MLHEVTVRFSEAAEICGPRKLNNVVGYYCLAEYRSSDTEPRDYCHFIIAERPDTVSIAADDILIIEFEPQRIV